MLKQRGSYTCTLEKQLLKSVTLLKEVVKMHFDLHWCSEGDVRLNVDGEKNCLPQGFSTGRGGSDLGGHWVMSADIFRCHTGKGTSHRW